MKTCKDCKIEKDDSLFPKTGRVCKECKSIYRRKDYEKNKSKVKEQQKEYYEANKIDILAQQQVYLSIEENLDKHKATTQVYYEENKSDILTHQKDYKQNNKNKRRDYENNRLKEDPAYKLRKSISRAIFGALKSNGSSKQGKSIMSYLQQTTDELRYHLELQFESWMTWENWGVYNPSTWDDNDEATWTWHLDHVIPQSKLPFSSMEAPNFLKCWSLSNLRPYSAKKNVIEGDRREIFDDKAKKTTK